jgi:bifunctional non-homologous end joining protein LigD
VSEQPRWIDPMKATLTTGYFSDPEWIFEPKLDGIRCLAFRHDGKVRLLSRNKLDLSTRSSAVVKALDRQEHDFIVDGEIAAVADGKTSFALLQQARRQEVAVEYFAFDILHLDGRDLRKLPLIKRKAQLEAALVWRKPLLFVEHIAGDGEAYYKAACDQGLEGVIAKRAHSTYTSTRSKEWLKFKCSNQQEFVIGGFTDPQGTRVGFGALLVGYYDGKDLRYAGKVGTGYSSGFLLELREKLDRLEIDEAPFVDPRGIKRKGVHWVKPRFVAQVAFSEWTSDGRLRHPRFVGLRSDKSAKEVVREGV